MTNALPRLLLQYCLVSVTLRTTTRQPRRETAADSATASSGTDTAVAAPAPALRPSLTDAMAKVACSASAMRASWTPRRTGAGLQAACALRLPPLLLLPAPSSSLRLGGGGARSSWHSRWLMPIT